MRKHLTNYGFYILISNVNKVRLCVRAFNDFLITNIYSE